MVLLALLFLVVLALTLLACLAGGTVRHVDDAVRRAGTWLAGRVGRVPAVVALAVGGWIITMAVLAPLGLASRATEGSIDHPLYRRIYPHVHGTSDLTKTMSTLTSMGNRSTMELVALISALILGIAYGRRWPVPVVAILAAVVMQREGQILLTHLVHRTPPPVINAGVFPSGGVSRLIAVYGIIIALALDLLPAAAQSLWRPRAWTGLALFAVTEAYSRIYLSLHWLTDVITGLLLGYLLLAFEVAALQAAVGDDTSRTDPTTARGADARDDETAGRSEPGATRA